MATLQKQLLCTLKRPYKRSFLIQMALGIKDVASLRPALSPINFNHGTTNHAVHHFVIHCYLLLSLLVIVVTLNSNHASSRLIHSGPTKHSTIGDPDDPEDHEATTSTPDDPEDHEASNTTTCDPRRSARSRGSNSTNF
jgi:hypothetical protein